MIFHLVMLGLIIGVMTFYAIDLSRRITQNHTEIKKLLGCIDKEEQIAKQQYHTAFNGYWTGSTKVSGLNDVR